MRGYRRKLVLRSYSGSYVTFENWAVARNKKQWIRKCLQDSTSYSGTGTAPTSSGTGTWKKGCVYTSSQ